MKIVKNRQFKAKVTVDFPADDGAVETQSFTARFRALSVPEIAEHKLLDTAGQDAFLKAVLMGWEGLTDDRDGEEVPLVFSPEAMTMVLSDLFVRRAVIDTYQAQLMGAKRGN